MRKPFQVHAVRKHLSKANHWPVRSQMMQLNAPGAVADKLTMAQRKAWHQLLHTGPDAVSTSQRSWGQFCSVVQQSWGNPPISHTWHRLTEEHCWLGLTQVIGGQAKAKLPQQVAFTSLRKYFLFLTSIHGVWDHFVWITKSVWANMSHMCV